MRKIKARDFLAALGGSKGVLGHWSGAKKVWNSESYVNLLER